VTTYRSPLHSEHVRLGAKLTPFGGWEMPLQYAGVLAEHRCVRSEAGLFDVSHLGKVTVDGPGAADFLDRMLPGKVASLGEWRAAYNIVLNEQAGIVDDIFVYRRPEGFIVVPNASNTVAVLDMLASAAGPGVHVVDSRMEWAIIALSGPRARSIILADMPEVADLKLHRLTEGVFRGTPSLVARTGYTGEVTFEFLVAWDRAKDLWLSLLDAGATPTGLGARDTLRLEMGYPLHGHEISESTNPIEAGLEWVIDWTKPFFARDVLEKIRDKGVSRRLAGVIGVGREIPRAGQAILESGRQVGELTSGNFSPVLGRGIGMGYVPPELAAPGTMLVVDVRGKMLDVEVTKPPFIPQ